MRARYGVQILAEINVALHVALERRVVDPTGSVIEELLRGSHWRDVPVHHQAVEVAREVAGGGRPRDLLRAQEHPVLNSLPPIAGGGILGPGLLCLDEPLKKTKVGARNPTQQPRLNEPSPQPTRGFRMFNVGEAPPVGDAKDDRLRLRPTVWSAWSDQLLNSRNEAWRRGPSCARPAPRDSSWR